jgi:Ca2+-binding EF-hand superfamily protein
MLTQAEIDGCREAFSRFDRDGELARSQTTPHNFS